MEQVEQNTGLEFNRPYSEADFDGYSAAPLLIVGGRSQKKLIASQDRLARQFTEATRYELDDVVKPDIIDFVAQSISRRMQQREGLNGSEYIKRLHKFRSFKAVPEASALEVYKASRNALYGRGTVRQNDMARRAFGMASAEYANLTIIGDFRKNLEEPMWDEVGELLDIDATPRFEQMTNFQVLAFDRDITCENHVGAMRIGMKRELGTLSDGTVMKARTTAIINTRPSSYIDQDNVAAIRSATIEKTNMADVPEFLNVVRWLIDEVLPSGVSLARNETVYGFNQSTFDEIAAQRGFHY